MSGFSLGPLTVHFYALAYLVGIAVAIALTRRRWRAAGGDPDLVYDVALWSVLAGIVGGRIYFDLTTPFDIPHVWYGFAAVWDGGLGIWGGVALGGAVGVWRVHRAGADWRVFGDAVAPGVLLAQAVGRIGNYFNQELFGKPSTLPWAVEISPRARVDQHVPARYLHVATFQPSFLYELIFDVALAVFLVWLGRHRSIRAPGVLALYAAGYSAYRIFEETIRVDSSAYFLGMRLNFFIAIACTASGLAWFGYTQLRRGPRATTPGGPARDAESGPSARARPGSGAQSSTAWQEHDAQRVIDPGGREGAEPAVPAERHAHSAGGRRHRIRWPAFTVAAVITVVAVAGAVNIIRPLPPAQVALAPVPASTSTRLAWPGYGQAAVAAEGYGVLASHGAQTPVATASIAKVITALCVLQREPLRIGQAGPVYTVRPADAAAYRRDLARGDSVAAVSPGEQLTEYQALQALMLPSADNIADSLARWVFGSLGGYRRAADAFLAAHHLAHTRIGPDASGLNPATTSTATDLASLALVAQHNRVLMQIAAQTSAVLPVAGRVFNTDTDLGVAAITGLKTGNNDSDTGAFLFTATVRRAGGPIPISGAVLGAPTLAAALGAAAGLAASVRAGLHDITLAAAGRPVGAEHTAWGASAPVTAARPVPLVRWQNSPIREAAPPDVRAWHGTIGTLRLACGPDRATVPLRLPHAVPGPSLWWRLTRF